MPAVWIDASECTRDGYLPPVCMKCGAEAHETVRQSFRWVPPWVNVMALLSLVLGGTGIVVWIILSIVLSKSMAVYVPLCFEHRNAFRNRVLAIAVTIGAALAALGIGIGLTIAFDPPGPGLPNESRGLPVFVGVMVMLVLFFVAAFIARGGIAATEMTDRDVRLKRVHPDFIAALKDQRRAERERRETRRRDDDGDRERRPGNPRPDNDGRGMGLPRYDA